MTKTWPGKPGVPINADRDGWHWVRSSEGIVPALWARPFWRHCRDFWDQRSPEWMEDRGWRYLGPVLTPDEVANREDAKWHEGYAVGVLDVRRGTAFGEPDTHYAALQARVAELVEALGTLEKAASYTAKLGAVTGAHWLGLGTALIKARAALTGEER